MNDLTITIDDTGDRIESRVGIKGTELIEALGRAVALALSIPDDMATVTPGFDPAEARDVIMAVAAEVADEMKHAESSSIRMWETPKEDA